MTTPTTTWTQTKKCVISAIIDKSLSMSPLRKETISGFNNFLKEQPSASGPGAYVYHAV